MSWGRELGPGDVHQAREQGGYHAIRLLISASGDCRLRCWNARAIQRQPISPLYLPDISPTSPLHLPCAAGTRWPYSANYDPDPPLALPLTLPLTFLWPLTVTLTLALTLLLALT